MKKLLIACGCLILISLVVTIMLLRRDQKPLTTATSQSSVPQVERSDVGANFTISPMTVGLISAQVGKDLGLLINMQPLSELKEIQLSVSYDPSHLSYSSYALGKNFLNSKKPEVTVDPQKGTLTFAIVANDAFQNGGALMTLSFRPTASGSTSVTLSPKSYVVTIKGEKKQATVPTQGSFTIQ